LGGDNVKSSVVADISGFLSYNLKLIEVSLLASTYFNNGNSADIFTGLTLNRNFFSSNQQFLINPTIAVYAGSQHFYQEYYSSSRLGNRKNKGKGQSMSDSATEVSTLVEIQDVSQFNIMNVEISLPLQYYYKQFIFSLTQFWPYPRLVRLLQRKIWSSLKIWKVPSIFQPALVTGLIPK
jgi:hypothetical protein